MSCVSSSGLIYAVIVGAWAAYLVPMWLRRQDELNEARPTERFSTAIRLLSGRAAMERKYAKAREEAEPEPPAASRHEPEPEPDAPLEPVDVRALAVPAPQPKPASTLATAQPKSKRPAPPKTARAKVLARRRRSTTMLFLAFTAGMIVAAVGGLAFLWAPAVPAVLLTLYIAHLRRQEHRRFEVKLDQRRAAEAAQRLRDRPAPRRPAPAEPKKQAQPPQPEPHTQPHTHPQPQRYAQPQPESAARPRLHPKEPAATAGRRALVEQTDHAEWVDQQREQRSAPAEESWAPAPVPRPTFVTAPVTRRRTADRSRTPLFDQQSGPADLDLDRPRAANE